MFDLNNLYTLTDIYMQFSMFDFAVCRCIHFARHLFTSNAMAKSKYEYVRTYEQDVRVALNNFIVLRIDGRGFHR